MTGEAVTKKRYAYIDFLRNSDIHTFKPLSVEIVENEWRPAECQNLITGLAFVLHTRQRGKVLSVSPHPFSSNTAHSVQHAFYCVRRFDILPALKSEESLCSV